MEINQNNGLYVSSGTIVKIICIVILFFVAFYLRDLLLAVLGAVVVAAAIEPVTRWFIDKKIPRVPAVLLIYLILALLFVAIFYFLIIPLMQDLATFLGSLSTYLGSTDTLGAVKTSSNQLLSGFTQNFSFKEIVSQFNVLVTNLSEGFWNSASFIFGGVLSLVIVIVLSFYLAVQDDGIGKFLRTVSPLKHRKYVAHLWSRSQQKIGLWMQGQLLLVIIIAVLVYLGLMLLGIQHALLLAVLAGIFELIPLFGPILAAVPAVATAFVGGGFSLALLIVGLYIIIQQFENQLIYPLVVKKVVGVPPIISIVAIVAGVQLAGFMGLILSVPVAAILMEFFNDLQRDQVLEEEALSKK